MKQRAIKDGVLSSPYRYVVAGEVFDSDGKMNWAVEIPDASAEPSREPEPAKPTAKGKRHKDDTPQDDILK